MEFITTIIIPFLVYFVFCYIIQKLWNLFCFWLIDFAIENDKIWNDMCRVFGFDLY